MQCPYCKEDNPPGIAKCGFCGESLKHIPISQTPKSQTHTASASEYTNYVPDYLVQAILVTVCCCLPFGIVAIVYAARVKAFLLGGQVAMAEEASEKAKMWCWVGFGLGIVIGGFYMLMVAVEAGLSSF